jgi:ribulose 1,5-bisphosphate synthetase/thiazole synthase
MKQHERAGVTVRANTHGTAAGAAADDCYDVVLVGAGQSGLAASIESDHTRAALAARAAGGA